MIHILVYVVVGPLCCARAGIAFRVGEKLQGGTRGIALIDIVAAIFSMYFRTSLGRDLLQFCARGVVNIL